MPPRKKTFEDLEEVLSFFPRSSAKLIERLLKRVRDREAKKAARGVPNALRMASFPGNTPRSSGVPLERELSKALTQRPPAKEKASVRQTAPDTGGRPFHFSYSVSKRGAASTSEGRVFDGSDRHKVGKAAAHMKYIERQDAIENAKRPDGGLDKRKPADEETAHERDDGSWDRDRTERSQQSQPDDIKFPQSSSKAGQAYIENPSKIATSEGVIFSFGTIGETLEERMQFWELLEEHERKADARVQSRLILELPHEATPEARHEMVKAFCAKFDEKAIPYWAALHAPGPDNDSRNFHAHVVFSERPATKMIDPDDGQQKWDFSIRHSYRTKSRNVRYHNPYRQQRDPDLRRRDAIPQMRRHFSDVVNRVLIRDDVRNPKGVPVRYDARSYEAMGLEIAPMRSIDRIVAGAFKKGVRTVLDGDYTRKMIEERLREAAARRDPKLLDLFKLDKALFQLAKAPRRAPRLNTQLPRDMRVSPMAHLTKAAVKKSSAKLLQAYRDTLRLDMMERATGETLRSVIAATDPSVVAKSFEKTDDQGERAKLVDPACAALLHAEALRMLAETEAEAATARKKAKLRGANALTAWREMADPHPGPSLASQIAMSSAQAVIGIAIPVRRMEAVLPPPAPLAERADGRLATDESPRAARPKPAAEAGRTQPPAGHEAVRPAVDRVGTADPQAAGHPSETTPARDAPLQPETVTIGGRTMPVEQFALARQAARILAGQGAARKARGGPAMPDMPAMPEMGIAAEISAAITAMHKAIADGYPDVEDRLNAIGGMGIAGRKFHEERLAEKAREAAQAANKAEPPAAVPEAAASEQPVTPGPANAGETRATAPVSTPETSQVTVAADLPIEPMPKQDERLAVDAGTADPTTTGGESAARAGDVALRLPDRPPTPTGAGARRTAATAPGSPPEAGRAEEAATLSVEPASTSSSAAETMARPASDKPRNGAGERATNMEQSETPEEADARKKAKKRKRDERRKKERAAILSRRARGR